MVAKEYLSLTKPRLALVNVLAAAAGLMFGPLFSWSSLTLMALGLFCIIGSACTFNNLYDRDIDARMERTRTRALVEGRISMRNAFLFGIVLLAIGSVLLYQVNALTLIAALVGFISYVFLYTPFKHKSGLALFVGAIAGATPPVVGYAASGGSLDMIAALLFILMYIWQLPHFIAIAMYRYSEYHAAGVPLLITKERSAYQQKMARGVFHATLVVLTLACTAAIAYRALL